MSLSPMMASYGPRSAQRVRDALDVGRANNAAHIAAKGRQTRAALADRLDLPADASNMQIFASLDAKLAAGKSAPTPASASRNAVPAQSADDALYEAMYGPTPAAAARRALSADDALYEAMYG